MTDPVQQVAEATGLPPEAAREALDAMDLQFKTGHVPPGLLTPRHPLGRVARIFHRRGMWSLSADMLAQSEGASDEG